MKAAALRCQLLLILLMSAVMLLPGTNGSLLLVQRTVTRTIVLQETISKGLSKDVFIFRKQEIILRCPHSQEAGFFSSSWTGVFSSCCLALDSSSSFPCPAFRAIAKSQHLYQTLIDSKSSSPDQMAALKLHFTHFISSGKYPEQQTQAQKRYLL
ncbi:hypothetical protein STEG23_036040, partial [Scotinomys teguina]